ncbi:isocitrate lyase/phosphoenolpyruvate mutase family protein [Streptomyces sp. NPDC001407]|uniref:isocitrate lyase/phosphoenolpyruvate mutase family protein n=1 Tax=Streptomyces sp. NPDC001407 TaxID=3364573 RepID=UPI0036AFC607
MTTHTTDTSTSPLGKLLAHAASARSLVRAVGAAHAPAARIAAEAGFDALWVSGLEVSCALGLPDENVLTSRDLADVVLALGRTTPLPVIVDIDNAGGSAATARRFGQDLARTGAAALCLEDSAYPKCNSFAVHRRQQLADPHLMLDQLAALRDAAGEGTLLIARTEALICDQPLSAALDRARTYAQAGADAVLVHSKDTTGTQALRSAAAWTLPVPLVTVPTAFPQLGPDRLAEAGFALAIYANQLSRAALAAMRTAAQTFRATGTFDGVELAAVGELLQVADPAARSCL